MKKTLNKLFTLVIIAFAAIALTGCTKNTIDDKTIVVGASPNPHAKILEQARPYIESKGYKLVIKTYSDYILPNVALTEGELDANFFQHISYLNKYNEQNNTDLVSVYAVHYEPLGLYAGISTSLDNIKQGAKIGVPNDATNFARALLLLDALNIIEVDPSKGVDVSENDITSNHYNVEIIKFVAESIPAQLVELDFAVINGNYAESYKLDKSKLLGQEEAEGVAAKSYGNIIAVKNGNQDYEAIKILIEALSQDSIKEYILNNYKDTVIPF